MKGSIQLKVSTAQRQSHFWPTLLRLTYFLLYYLLVLSMQGCWVNSLQQIGCLNIRKHKLLSTSGHMIQCSSHFEVNFDLLFEP